MEKKTKNIVFVAAVVIFVGVVFALGVSFLNKKKPSNLEKKADEEHQI